MPELPEVETTRRGIAPHLENQCLRQVVIRQRRLRWPVTRGLDGLLRGQTLHRVRRRAKYLLLDFERGSLLIHLGMSGSLRLLNEDTPVQKHDHVDLVFQSGTCLRYRDPRRFGAILWAGAHPLDHPLLRALGPEPLSAAFHGDYLASQAHGRHCAIKNLIMDNRIVVGVGNIYANEALFLAGIHPARAAGRVSRQRCRQLAEHIKTVLAAAIEQGGTTLKDFTDSEGRPGYFAQRLRVYGRAGEACPGCGQPLRSRVIGQRNSFYCGRCQT